jgi:DNA/RNA endonuclease YhcR with UshA esterase domain
VRYLPIGSRVTIEGTVTAEPGRILDPLVLVVQDGTGGLPIRLARGSATDGLDRGRIVLASGSLASPYGNLELRLDHDEAVTVIGSGGIPEPEELQAAGIGEQSEGLLAMVGGEIEHVDRSSGGSISVTISDGSGQARVVLGHQFEHERSRLVVGRRLLATGIVGQRASRRDKPDGYRLWPRDDQDLVIEASPRPTPSPRPTRTPRATPTPRPSRSPRPSRPPLTRIRDASFGSTVTVEGVVTAQAGLLDSDGRRITIQDGSGGILMRLPEDEGAPQIGARVQATGEVATYYGAPQLEVADAPRLLARRRALPVVMRRAPGADEEWRLVRVTVRVVELSRSGDTWRAEASLGAGGSLPIVGIATSGIPSTVLEEGRSATITGIVKRAYPTASDQRFALVPRFAADVELGPAARPLPDRSAAPGPGDPTSPTASPGILGPTDPAGSADGVVDAKLVQLPSLVGRWVRIGGTLRDVEASVLTLDDDTATALARIEDGVDAILPPLEPGEVLNLTGRVVSSAEGVEVAARARDVIRAAALPAGTDPPSTGAPPARDSAPTAGTAADVSGQAIRLALALTASCVATFAALAAGVVVLRSRRRDRAGPDETPTAPRGPEPHAPA